MTMIIRKAAPRVAVAAVVALLAAVAAPAQTPVAKGAMAYDAAGPMEITHQSAGGAIGQSGEAAAGIPGPTCTIFRPKTLGAGGMKHPIVLWGNGTGMTPVGYTGILENLASYGFVVGAANTINAGKGTEMLACLDWLTAENARAGSPYEGKLDLTKVGASGHSQGGGGTLMAGRDLRVKTTAPVMPYTLGLNYVRGAEAQQHGPILLLSGGADTIAAPDRNQKPVFDGANTPITWATLGGASHLAPMRGGGPYVGIITAWFRYQLMDDTKAATLFTGPQCGYCTAAEWTIQRKG